MSDTKTISRKAWNEARHRLTASLREATVLHQQAEQSSAAGFFAHEVPGLVIVATGTLQVVGPELTTILSAGEVLLQPPGTGYRFKAAAAVEAGLILTVQDEISCSVMYRTEAQPADGELRWLRGSILAPGGAGLRYLLQAILALRSEGQGAIRTAIFPVVRALLAEALNGPVRHGEGGPNLVARARSLLAERFLDPACSVRSLASELGCHPDHLGRSFRASSGKGVREVLADLRLERARELLLNDRDASVGSIALRSGFRSASRLSEHFSARYGISPTTFRRLGHNQ